MDYPTLDNGGIIVLILLALILLNELVRWLSTRGRAEHYRPRHIWSRR